MTPDLDVGADVFGYTSFLVESSIRISNFVRSGQFICYQVVFRDELIIDEVRCGPRINKSFGLHFLSIYPKCNRKAECLFLVASRVNYTRFLYYFY